MPSSEARKERRLQQRLHQLDPLKRTPDPIDVYINRWIMRLTGLALTRRKWEGLPDSIDERYLEKTLLQTGSAIIFNHHGDALAQRLVQNSSFDAQENIQKRSATGANGSYQDSLDELNSVIVYDNSLRTPIYPEIMQFARDLALHDLEIMQNVKLQNSFFILQVPREMKTEGETILRNMGMGIAGMLATEGLLNEIEPKLLSTGVTPVMDQLNSSKSQIYNEALSFMGINHVPVEKGERLVQAEAEAASDTIERQRRFYLNEAQRAADEMNNLFGWNVSVSWYTVDSSFEENGDFPELVQDAEYKKVNGNGFQSNASR